MEQRCDWSAYDRYAVNSRGQHFHESMYFHPFDDVHSKKSSRATLNSNGNAQSASLHNHTSTGQSSTLNNNTDNSESASLTNHTSTGLSAPLNNNSSTAQSVTLNNKTGNAQSATLNNNPTTQNATLTNNTGTAQLSPCEGQETTDGATMELLPMGNGAPSPSSSQTQPTPTTPTTSTTPVRVPETAAERRASSATGDGGDPGWSCTPNAGHRLAAVLFASLALLIDTSLFGMLLINFQDLISVGYTTQVDILKTESFNALKWLSQLLVCAAVPRLIARWGSQITMAVGFGTLFLATTVFGTQQGYELYMIGSAIQGAGAAVAVTSSLALMASRSPDVAFRRVAFGVVVAVASVSYGVAHPMAHLQRLVGHLTVFRVGSGVCFITVIMTFCGLKPSQQVNSENTRQQPLEADHPELQSKWQRRIAGGTKASLLCGCCLAIAATEAIEQPSVVFYSYLYLEMAVGLKVLSVCVGVLMSLMLTRCVKCFVHYPLVLAALGLLMQAAAYVFAVGELIPSVRLALAGHWRLSLVPMFVFYGGHGLVQATVLPLFADFAAADAPPSSVPTVSSQADVVAAPWQARHNSQRRRPFVQAHAYALAVAVTAATQLARHAASPWVDMSTQSAVTVPAAVVCAALLAALSGGWRGGARQKRLP